MASGSIEAEEVTVAAELGGRVMETAADEGDEVSAGSLLLQVDRRTLLAQHEGASATVDQAQAALEAAEAELVRAEGRRHRGRDRRGRSSRPGRRRRRRRG